eukprot:14924885-Alexandrium_andersonii.AAC.1
MSASLVGSEMCIRDSFGKPPTSASLISRELARGPALSREGDGKGLPLNCLLYTSDAADDM